MAQHEISRCPLQVRKRRAPPARVYEVRRPQPSSTMGVNFDSSRAQARGRVTAAPPSPRLRPPMPPPISNAALRRQTVPTGPKQQRVQGKRHGDTAAASVANTLRATVWLAMRCPWGNSQRLRKASLHGDCGCVLQASLPVAQLAVEVAHCCFSLVAQDGLGRRRVGPHGAARTQAHCCFSLVGKAGE
jgi:hypothetical protein